ncbi:MAG: Bug family tripartite tricarboxylate transporter substrate binding protein [Candidatus Binatia bacterium]
METKTRRLIISAEISTAALVALFLLIHRPVFAQTPFYQGKTLTIIQGRDPGGTGDVRARTVIPFLQKYIPGNPNIVMEYMPGGGSRKAANHLFTSAKPDGLTIGNVSNGMVASAILKTTGVLYDLDKFVYLGSPFSSHHAVFVTRNELGLNSLEKLRAASGLRIGGQSVGFSTYNEGRLFAYILRLSAPTFVTGYGGAELDPALMRGEIDARATSADTVLRRNPDWLKKHVVDFHAIIEVPKGEKHPQFMKLPGLETLAKSDLDRKLVSLQRSFRVTGQPFVAPPGIPRDRVVILQEAFRKTYLDPEFQKDYKKVTRDDPTPLLPENHEKAIEEIPRDPEVIEVFNKLIGGGPLPTHR